MKKIFYGICTLTGTIMGVGLFSLPYIYYQVGIRVMLFYFFILGAVTIVMHLLLCEIALKTPDFLRLPGFAKFHLGKWGERAAFFVISVSGFGAILAYILIGGKFLSGLLSPFVGGTEFIYVLIYFTLGAILIYFGIEAICKVELWGIILFFLILTVIFFQGLPFFKTENLLVMAGNKDLFFPYGPVLFSFWGTALIPEVEEMLGKRKYLLKKIVVIATLIPIIIYLSFMFLVVGITGQNTSQEAIEGLRIFLGDKIIQLAFFCGLVTTFTSFIGLGLTIKKVFWYDFKIDKNLSWLITCFIPLFLFLIGINNFIEVISFVGGITIGIEGILIILMYQKIKKTKISLLAYPLIIFFILGIIYQITYFIK